MNSTKICKTGRSTRKRFRDSEVKRLDEKRNFLIKRVFGNVKRLYCNRMRVLRENSRTKSEFWKKSKRWKRFLLLEKARTGIDIYWAKKEKTTK